MYVKKAGTVILAVSILIWAMMTFPTLSAEKAKYFEQRVSKITSEFLALPAASEVFKTEADLEEFEKFRKQLEGRKAKGLENQKQVFLALARALGSESKALKTDDALKAVMLPLADAFKKYTEEKTAVENEKQSEGLKNTVGGRVGVAMEYVFKPIGFDWRTNVALVGGFAAKEVVVSTLGTAYSLGEVNRKEALSLAERLKSEPGWNPLLAFSLIIFVMLYNPCFTTLVVIGRESGKWRWSLFAMVYTTTLAYCMAFLVHSIGSLLKLGV
jgi:ferrous iron transport protein B